MNIEWSDAQALKRNLISQGWHTPDTYGNEYESPKNQSAVYLFLLHGWVDDEDFHDFGKAIVAYVGMSARLKQRWQTHNVLRDLRASGRYIQRWFQPVPKVDLRERELILIKEYEPPWNIQGRKRGVNL